MRNIIILYLCLGICVKLLEAGSRDASDVSALTEGENSEQGGTSQVSQATRVTHASHSSQISQTPNKDFPNTARITHTLDAATLAGIVISDLFPEVVIYNLLGDLGKFNSKSLLEIFEKMAELATDLFIEYKILQGEFITDITTVVDSIKSDDDITNALLDAKKKRKSRIRRGK